ncbi:hypothetical protein E1218_12220 [Kribbella turkmenica]|uniref:DUF6351 domain-containing protein n=1 Tax=Kribbella turkmenica TaxID=2530375 RepID=A0A4R4X8M1_9ACTN|nr:hypothetical protein E1218_12220 [Kribbella turkmenica]
MAPNGQAAGDPSRSSRGEVRIEVLSNRADLVSGGDALVEVDAPWRSDTRTVRVSLNGRDITELFDRRPNGRYQGLVTGLRGGSNKLTVREKGTGRGHGAQLTITNHSQQGPIFAGKQVEPWVCETEQFGLGPATGPACAAATRYDFFYKAAGTNSFETYDPASPPARARVATTTTDEGKTVPYVVRRERGVIDRGIYDVAVLFDPDEAWQPWAPQRAWNRKLHWLFGGSSAPGHRQGGIAGVPNVLNDLLLSRGHAVASSSLTVGANNVNDVVMAEAVMMVKEHVIETYGPVRHTTSSGASGGGAAQYGIADNYPGLLDGLIPEMAVPDMWSWGPFELADCDQLGNYFNKISPQLWADADDRAAVSGTYPGAACQTWGSVGNGWFNPTVGCTFMNPEPDWVYSPQTNPTGVRCTNQDYMTNVFGNRTSDGFANRALDNVGLQYGLETLLRGEISPDQFVDLNVKIGGRDIDYNWIPQRTRADDKALQAVYRSGRITYGRQLAQVPIMDIRRFDASDVHAKVHSQMERERLIAANGTAANLVSWAQNEADPALYRQLFATALTTLDEWLAGVKRDTSQAPLEIKVLRHKPAKAKSTCWEGGKPSAHCLPTYQMPRMVAGGPLANDIVKCQLTPIDWDAYGSVKFTEGQKQQLRLAFPSGVCDWTKPGVGQQRPIGVWQTFTGTTGGRPLADPPQSSPTKPLG